MKLLLDQNLSRRLVGRLSNEYPGSGHVTEVGLDIASDRAIWEYAGERDYVIVSKDTDFRQLAFLSCRSSPEGGRSIQHSIQQIRRYRASQVITSRTDRRTKRW